MYETCRRAREANALGVKRVDWNAHIPDEREVPATGQEPPGSLGLGRPDDDWFLVKRKHALQPPSTVLVEELIFRPDVFVVKPHGDRGAGDGPVYINQGLRRDGKGKLPATATSSGALRRLELDAAEFFDLLFSDRWSEGCVLRVLRGQLLDDLLLALNRLATSHDVVSFATLVYLHDRRPLLSNIKNARVIQNEKQETLKQTVLVELDYFCPQQQPRVHSPVKLEISSDQNKTETMLDRKWSEEPVARALQEGNVNIVGSVCNIRGQIRPPPHEDCHAFNHTIRDPLCIRRYRERAVSPAIVPAATLPSVQQLQSQSNRKLEEKNKYDVADEIFLGVRDPDGVEMAASDPFLDLYDLPETLPKKNAQSHKEEKQKIEKKSSKQKVKSASSIRCDDDDDDDEHPLFANFDLEREKQLQEDIRLMALEFITNTNVSPLERTQMSRRLKLALAAQRRIQKSMPRKILSSFLPQMKIQKPHIMPQKMLANNMTAISDRTNKIKARNLPFLKNAQLPSLLEKIALPMGKMYMKKSPSELRQMNNMLSPQGSGKMHNQELMEDEKLLKSTSVQFQALPSYAEFDDLDGPSEKNISLQQKNTGKRTPLKKKEKQAKTADQGITEASLLKYWERCPTFKEFSEYLAQQSANILMKNGKNKQAKGKETSKTKVLAHKDTSAVGKTFISEPQDKASKEESTSKKERDLTKAKAGLITCGKDELEYDDASEDSEGINKKNLQISKHSLTQKDDKTKSRERGKQKSDSTTRVKRLMSNEQTSKDKLRKGGQESDSTTRVKRLISNEQTSKENVSRGKGKVGQETDVKKKGIESENRQNLKRNANKELKSSIGKLSAEKTGSDRKKSTRPLEINSKARWFSKTLQESSENLPRRSSKSAPDITESLPQILSGLKQPESVRWLASQVVKGMNSSDEKVLTEEEDELLLLEDYIISEMDPWHISVRFAYLAGDLCNSIGVRNDLLRRREHIISTISRSKTKLKLNQQQMWVLIREIMNETNVAIKQEQSTSFDQRSRLNKSSQESAVDISGISLKESTLKIDENLDRDQIQSFSSTSVTLDTGCNLSHSGKINQTQNARAESSTCNSALSTTPKHHSKTDKDSCNNAAGQDNINSTGTESTSKESADDNRDIENDDDKSNTRREKVSISQKVKMTVQQSDETQNEESNAIISKGTEPYSSESQMFLERSEILKNEQSVFFDSSQEFYDEAELLVSPEPSELTLPSIVALRELRTRPSHSTIDEICESPHATRSHHATDSAHRLKGKQKSHPSMLNIFEGDESKMDASLRPTTSNIVALRGKMAAQAQGMQQQYNKKAAGTPYDKKIPTSSITNLFEPKAASSIDLDLSRRNHPHKQHSSRGMGGQYQDADRKTYKDTGKDGSSRKGRDEEKISDKNKEHMKKDMKTNIQKQKSKTGDREGGSSGKAVMGADEVQDKDVFTTKKKKTSSHKASRTGLEPEKNKTFTRGGETGKLQDNALSKGRKGKYCEESDDFDQTGKQGHKQRKGKYNEGSDDFDQTGKQGHKQKNGKYSEGSDDFDWTGKRGNKQRRDDFDQKAGKGLKGNDGLFPDINGTAKSQKKAKGGKPNANEGVGLEEDELFLHKGIFDTEKLKSSYSFEKMYAHRPNVLPNYKKLLAEFEKPFKGKKTHKAKETTEFEKPLKGKKPPKAKETAAAVSEYLSKDESKIGVGEPPDSEANPPVVIGSLRRNYKFFQGPEYMEYVHRKPQPVQSLRNEMSFDNVCQLLTAATKSSLKQPEQLFLVRKERATTLFGTCQYDSRVTVTFTRRVAPDGSARDIVDFSVVAAVCDTLQSH